MRSRVGVGEDQELCFLSERDELSISLLPLRALADEWFWLDFSFRALSLSARWARLSSCLLNSSFVSGGNASMRFIVSLKMMLVLLARTVNRIRT